MIARYLLWIELGFTRQQARALTDAEYVVTRWAEVTNG